MDAYFHIFVVYGSAWLAWVCAVRDRCQVMILACITIVFFVAVVWHVLNDLEKKL
jgi:hypothetical protein